MGEDILTCQIFNQPHTKPHYLKYSLLTYGDDEGYVDPAGFAPLLEVDHVAALWRRHRHLHAQLVALAEADAEAAEAADVVVEDAAVVERRVTARLAAARGVVGQAADAREKN